MQCDHLRITFDLGQDGSGADFGDAGIALHHGGCGHLDIGTAVAVDEHMLRRYRQLLDRLLHRQQGGLQDVDAVDFAGVDADHAPGDGAFANLPGELFAATGAELFGIGETVNRVVVVENHRGGNDVAHQRPAAGLVHPCQQAFDDRQFILKLRNHSGRIAPVIIIIILAVS